MLAQYPIEPKIVVVAEHNEAPISAAARRARELSTKLVGNMRRYGDLFPSYYGIGTKDGREILVYKHHG